MAPANPQDLNSNLNERLPTETLTALLAAGDNGPECKNTHGAGVDFAWTAPEWLAKSTEMLQRGDDLQLLLWAALQTSRWVVEI